MKSMGRLCIGVGVTSILLLGWAKAQPGGLAGPAGDIGQIPDILSQIAADQQLGAELESKSVALHCANDRKQDIARELLEGRMSLAEAVNRFREIHKNLPIPWESMRKHYPGDTDNERFGRNVMSWVESEATDRPDQLEAVARLDAEFEHYLQESNP
jgi:hypothetical protein